MPLSRPSRTSTSTCPRRRRAPAAVLAAIAAIALQVALAAPAHAHMTILLVDPPTAKKGERVRVRFAFGHPFERDAADVEPPERIGVLLPRGECAVLAGGLRTIEARHEGRTVRSYEADFVPDERGDGLVHVVTKPMVHGDEVYTDFAKAVLHVQAEKGWERPIGKPLEIVPLTRPYGLFAGVTVRATLLQDGKPLAGCDVLVERFNDTAPEGVLPPDEAITRTERTDALGGFAATLPEPGWWVLCAEAKRGEVERDGRRLTEVHRALLWVYVDPPRAVPPVSGGAPVTGAPAPAPDAPVAAPAGPLERARQAKARADLATLETAVQLFHLDAGRWPERVADLLYQPEGLARWRGPYLAGGPRSLLDPWGRPYRLERAASGAPELSSWGADGAAGGAGEDADLIHRVGGE